MKPRNVPIDSRPMTPAEFKDCSIRKIVSWYKKGRGLLNLTPEFQRKSVWKKKQRINLMNTILKCYPLPAVVFYKRYDKEAGGIRYDVIDGKQRLESILLFLGEYRGSHEDKWFEGRFSDFSSGQERIVRQSWKDLASKNKQMILNYKIPIVWVDGTLSDIHEIFRRINSTGTPLSGQEKRKATYIDNPMLREVSLFADSMRKKLKDMRVISDSDISRMRDVEILFEIVVSIINGGLLDAKYTLDSILKSNRTFGARKLSKAKNDVKWTVGYLKKLLPEISNMRYHNISDFYSLVLLLVDYRREGLILEDKKRMEEARRLLGKFAENVDESYDRYVRKLEYEIRPDPLAIGYINTIRGAADSIANRKNRRRILDGILRNVFKQKDTRRGFSPEQRRIIWGREKEHVCYLCKRSLTWDDFTIDHLFPHSKGGRSELSNARICCRRCNSKKGAR